MKLIKLLVTDTAKILLAMVAVVVFVPLIILEELEVAICGEELSWRNRVNLTATVVIFAVTAYTLDNSNVILAFFMN